LKKTNKKKKEGNLLKKDSTGDRNFISTVVLGNVEKKRDRQDGRLV